MENKQLVELHHENVNNKFTVGDLFVGKVKKVIPSLNAAFIDVGYQKDAFLHYTDLGPQVRSLIKFTNRSIKGDQPSTLKNFKLEADIIKTGKINEVLSQKQLLLVQILKEPISNKGPRLSSEINLAGRYMVISPFNNVISISKKITSLQERKRLLRLVESIKPPNFSVIIRTAAEGKKVSDLHEDLTFLTKKWAEITHNLKDCKSTVKILSEMDRTSSILRDLMNDTFNNIIVNDKYIYADIKSYINKIAPERQKIVSLYKNKYPVFDQYGITKQIKASFGNTVSMNSGAYLIIEHTEAAHIIDVNSGHKVSKDENQEDTALKVNLEAAEEIARQLRLRDLGGIVVIDFIDLKRVENRKQIFEAMKKFMRSDRAKHTILPLSKFCLMQITRQRVRPEINIVTAETCPTCSGTGKIRPAILLIDEIEKTLHFLLKEQNQKNIRLVVHPYTEAYLKRGLPSLQMKWFLTFKHWIKIKSNTDYHMTEYHLLDENDDEISL